MELSEENISPRYIEALDSMDDLSSIKEVPMSESNEKEKIRERLKNHIQQKKSWEAPNWLIYVIGSLALVALIYGGVQQLRIWRWSSLLSKTKHVIQRLQTEKTEIKYRVTKKFADKGIKEATTDLKLIEKEKKSLKKEIKKVREEVRSLDPVGVIEELTKEGF